MKCIDQSQTSEISKCTSEIPGISENFGMKSFNNNFFKSKEQQQNLKLSRSTYSSHAQKTPSKAGETVPLRKNYFVNISSFWCNWILIQMAKNADPLGNLQERNIKKS